MLRRPTDTEHGELATITWDTMEKRNGKCQYKSDCGKFVIWWHHEYWNVGEWNGKYWWGTAENQFHYLRDAFACAEDIKNGRAT